MALQTSTGKLTRTQEARFHSMKEEVGCIPCRLQGLGYTQPDINHMLTASRRKGHDFVYPLCKWHHVGMRIEGYSDVAMTYAFGPSLAKGSKPFHAAFGSDEDLLAETERLLLRFRSFANA